MVHYTQLPEYLCIMYIFFRIILYIYIIGAIISEIMEHATEILVTKCYSVKTGTVIDIYQSLSMNSLETLEDEKKQNNDNHVQLIQR